ncbi:hypothetical protein RI129_005083 [Pyrocoelia pectoralis]|uniref:Kinesin-like protein n=1 Tax=Pyrocoelia pectoralis TaxID=417401 RepID=A0AAN7VM32_9COLE
MLPSLNTPKNNLTTPKRLNKRIITKVPSETPECYTKVTVETPGPSKSASCESKCDELRNLTVAVRIRPMNSRELSVVGSTNIINVHNKKITIQTATVGSSITKLAYVFPYDHVFWSCNSTDVNYSSQEDVFSEIGEPLLETAFQGYNACLFAYGQTGSGKSYSMMGKDSEIVDYNNTVGIIPRFCKRLFDKINEVNSQFTTATVDISYFEIYNEKIHDLLPHSSNNMRIPLKVREHPVWGPYVVNLSTHTVKSYEELKSWLLLGNKNRATAATVMNEKSSRSHSIFSIELSLSDTNTQENLTRRSKVSLVDLAGSERLGSVSNNDDKHKQGIFINKSLLTLGKVISALADHRKGTQFVPYRESVLTWLLRESIGGNSFTSMLATITPAHIHLDETLATLRYACQARSIVNRAHINEDPHDRLIRELRTEVKRLQTLRQRYECDSLSGSDTQIDNSSEYLQELEDLRHKLLEKENELDVAQKNWENRYKEHELQQMEQLAQVEKKKEELESRVRVMSNITDNVNLSPYQTNFLEEVENILTFSPSRKQELIKKFQLWLNKCGCDYEVSLNKCGNYVNIVDSDTLNKATCAINEVENILIQEDVENCLNNLKWSDSSISEVDINSAMNDIYGAAKLLQPHINKDEKLRLVFAKFIKSTQALETALCNSISSNKSKKAVTFRL